MFLLQILTEELLLLFELVYMIFEVFCFPPLQIVLKGLKEIRSSRLESHSSPKLKKPQKVEGM